ncbi:MAG TPA: hypothetical protein PK096_00095 [Candidatus Saccharibacteria bacterium]|nr:hypothetical protein [Candidatus Saccharibacteria bacterium]HRK93755.1 hypothetical protein [Candidatus Saccharibacteria bacterium]
MSIRAAHHRAPTAQMTTAHPFGGPGHSYRGGMPMGIYVPSNEDWYFDAFQEKAEGIVPSLNGLVLGGKGVGKSTGFKEIAARLATIGAGHGLMRIAINDHKSEGEKSEYAKLGEFLGCDVYDIATRSVNIFEPRLELGELNTLEMAIMLCEHVAKAPLIGSPFDALKIAVSRMMATEPTLWSIQTLMKFGLSLTPDDIDAYYTGLHDRMRGQIAERITRYAESGADRAQVEGLEMSLAAIYDRSDNVSHQEIVQSGEHIASLLGTLMEGKYGRMLGGGDSLYDMLNQMAIIKDWRGVSKEAVSLMRAIDHRLEINAIERGLHNLYPNLELDDEDHQSMEDLAYARAKALKSKISRSVRKLSLSGSHRFSDYRKGGIGSELWSYGQSILDDMGFFLIGTQPNKKEYLDELQDRLNISDLDRRLLPDLPPRIFGLKLGETEPLTYVRFIPTPIELGLIQTESANEDMVNRPGLDRSKYERVARETGFALKAGGSSHV